MIRKLPFLFVIFCAVFFSASLNAQTVFINEIHYDNDGADAGEAIEVSGPAGTDLEGWTLALYNGSNGSEYGSIALSGIIPDQSSGFGTLSFEKSGIQNGSPDGLALIDNNNAVVQFLSYEGSLVAVGGPADGQSSTDIGIAENGTEAVGGSLQLTGTGTTYADFVWNSLAVSTFGNVNTDQSFGTSTDPGTDPDPEPEPEPDPDPTPDPDPVTTDFVAFINELHYDNAGGDVNEGVEIAAYAGADLTGWSLVLYNGNDGSSYKTVNLSGVVENQNGGFGTIFFAIAGLQNGSPDGVALVNADGELVQFLSYEGSFTAVGGPADGITSTAINVEETSSTPETGSLHLVGEGEVYSDFTWEITDINSFGAVNAGQTFLHETIVFINELHYDNVSTDSNEAIEVAGTAGTDLAGWSLALYNGNDGGVYNTISLSGILPNQDNHFGTLAFYPSSIQNGSPDAVALIDAEGNTVQFLSYEGTFAAVDGPATGLTSTDIGVEETGATAAEASLQLTGSGRYYADFVWAVTTSNTFGTINTDQSFGGTITPEPEPDPIDPDAIITIAEARAASEGALVTITGILTAADELGGPAYIQDATGAMAIYDQAVHGEGVFAIGDSITVQGTRTAYNELIQLSPVTQVENNSPATTSITPVTVILAEIQNYPGQLVRIENVSFATPGELFFGDSNYIITDASGGAELRIDNDVEGLVGLAQPENCDAIIALVSRFKDTFQLLPRMASDVPCAAPYVAPGDMIDLSKDETFDIAAWNIEWFGDEGNSPAAGNPLSDEIQRDSVLAVIKKLDLDVLTVEEISDDVLFADLVSRLPGYDYILSDGVSYPEPHGTDPHQKVGFIYKTSTVKPVSTKILLKSLHPYYGGNGDLLVDYPENDHTRFYASGRLPFLMTADVTINGATEQLDIIALHARANTGDLQSKYDMRKYDVEVLKDTLDAQYADRNVLILGDYNDDVDETVAEGINTTVSSYVSYVNDAANYKVVTSELSEAGRRSYAFYPNMIDHITITDGLFDNYIANTASVHYEFYDSDYTRTTSDHFAISARFKFTQPFVLNTVETTDVTCNSAADGTATVSVSGGVQPYSYEWSDAQTSAAATDLDAGTYSVTVTDARGENVTSGEVVISQPDAITFSTSDDSTVYAGYDNDTCKTLNVSEINTGDEAYEVVWSTGETTESISACPTETTTYSVTVTTASGCSLTKEITVTVEDVSCGNNKWNQKVQLCFRGKAMCVSKNAVPALLRNGATLGSCSDGKQPTASLTNVRVAQNPVHNVAKLYVESTGEVKVSFELYDFFGRKQYSSKEKVDAGRSEIYLDLHKLRKGIYFLKANVDGVVQQTKILIKN